MIADTFFMLECERCGRQCSGVKSESSRTMYNFDGPIGSPEDPNRDIMLCRDCAKEHHDYWNERWDDYYAGLL